MHSAALLLSACLFGGMVFYSFGFAPMLFKHMAIKDARPVLRGTFPYYYLAVIGLSAVAAIFSLQFSWLSFGLLAVISASTLFARQILMPMINRAADAGEDKKFKRLHGSSVGIQLIQILLAGWATVSLSVAKAAL